MSMFTTQKRADSASPYYPSDSQSSSSNTGANKTIIARGVKVEGDFMSQGDVVIEGEVHGKVATTGTLTLPLAIGFAGIGIGAGLYALGAGTRKAAAPPAP